MNAPFVPQLTRMQAGREPRGAHASRLLVVDPARGRLAERAFVDLASVLRPGDLVVVNDAATRPSSFLLSTLEEETLEARILDEREDGTFDVVLFGPGTWRDDTDLRPAPPPVLPGQVLVGWDGNAVVEAVSASSPRRVRLRLDASLRRGLLEAARPVQYSYMARDLTLAEVQTPYASRPWAAEMPSAGRALTVEVLCALRRRGVALARVTAAAGLSSTGDPALDRLLPLPERYEIAAGTMAAVRRARERGGRVVAVGTSTVRALESAARDGVEEGRGTASLILGPTTKLLAVDGILSGMHETNTTHDALLRAFAPAALVDAAVEWGRARGLLIHELGDHCLLLPDAA